MAKLYGNIAASALLTLDKSFARALGQPLDSTEVYYSLKDAEDYAATSAAYVGQTIVVVNNADKKATYYIIENTDGKLTEIYNKEDIDLIVQTEANRAKSAEAKLSNTIKSEGIRITEDLTSIREEANKEAYKVSTLIGGQQDEDKSVRTIANEELAAQLIPESAQEALDTLNEIASWIQQHPEDVAAINTAIQQLQKELAKEKRRSEKKDDELLAKIDEETERAIFEEQRLTERADKADRRLVGHDEQFATLSQTLAEEIERAAATEGDIRDSLNNYENVIGFVQTGEKTLVEVFNEVLEAETDRAKDAEQKLQQDLTKETNRATNKEDSLAKSIKENADANQALGGDIDKINQDLNLNNSMPPDAYIASEGLNYTIDYATKTAICNGIKEEWQGVIKDIVMADYYKGFPVVGISGSAFKNKGIVSFVFSNNITEINVGTLSGNQELKYVRLPKRLERIYKEISSSEQLNSIFIPKTLTHYDISSFSYLTDLFYEGSEDDWNKIEIRSSGNNLTKEELEQYLQNINIHYNCSLPGEVTKQSYVPSMDVIDQGRFEDKSEGYWFNEKLWKRFIQENRVYVHRGTGDNQNNPERGSYGMYALTYNANQILRNPWVSKADYPDGPPDEEAYPALDSIVQRWKDGSVHVPITPTQDQDATSKKYVDSKFTNYGLTDPSKATEGQFLVIKDGKIAYVTLANAEDTEV